MKAAKRLAKTCTRIYRPSFLKNKPKTLVFSHKKRAFWACFRENWVDKFGHWSSGHILLFGFESERMAAQLSFDDDCLVFNSL